MRKFTNEKMLEIFSYLETELKSSSSIKIEVLNPDIFLNSYAGTSIIIDDKEYIHRSIKSWVDLAQKLFCRISTPKIESKNTISIRFDKIDMKESFHNSKEDLEEKYGVDSNFFKIDKNEEPEIMISYLNSLKSVDLNSRKRVLNLGVNSGEEFELIRNYFKNFCEIEFVGIDYCNSAIDEANRVFKDDKNVKFYSHDINKLEELDLGEFDLIISIGTLQSSNLDFKKTFMDIVQKYLKKDGAIILGFPNCRWSDGEVIYGAKAPNYNFSEMSILFKDAVFCKKYLQQKKFRVTLTGKYYIFLTGTSIRK